MHLPAPENGAVVIVEHNPLLLTGIAAILHKQGYQCHCARDRQGALQAAGDAAPDLILCEADLGEDDGLELCRELKADPRLSGVPVMLLSASRDPQMVEKSLAAGGAYFLAKPFDPHVLVEMVDRALTAPQLA